MRFSVIIALVASAIVMAVPIQDSTETSQVEAIGLINQFAAANQMSQGEAISLLQQVAAAEGYELSEQDANFLPFLGGILSKVVPFAAKALGGLAKSAVGGVVNAVAGGGQPPAA